MSKQKKLFKVYLDTKDAEKHNGNMNSNVTFFLKNAITINNTIEALSMSVDTAEIPVSWYLINETNNTLVFSVGNNNYSVQIPPSNYNLKTLTSVLNYLMETVDVSNDLYNLKFTFESQYQFEILNTSTCLDILGFFKETTKTGVLQSNNLYKLTSDTPANLSGTKNLFFYSDLSIPVLTSSGYSSILLKAPISCSFGEIYFYENIQSLVYPLNTNVITQIHIKVKDDWGNYINFQGFNFSLTLTFYVNESDSNDIFDNQLMGVLLKNVEQLKSRDNNI